MAPRTSSTLAGTRTSHRAPIGQVRNEGGELADFHLIRKAYERVEGPRCAGRVVTNERDVEPTPMPDTGGRWRTSRFVDPADLRHDMHVTIVTFSPAR